MKKRTAKEIKRYIETYNQILVMFENKNDYEAMERTKLNLEKLKIELNGIKK